MATTFTQFLQMVILIVLAAIYGKEEIGAYAVFLAYSSVLLMVTTFAYQWSIPNIEEQDRLHDLMLLLLFLAIGSAALIGVVFGVAGYVMALPLSILVLFRTLILVSVQANIREQDYRALILGRVGPPVIILVLVLAIPFLGGPTTATSIVWAATCGYVSIGAVYAGYSMLPALRGPVLWDRIRQIANEERRFSIWVMPGAVLNRMAFEGPTVLLEATLGPGVAAQYAMTVRICAVPISTVGHAISHVYHGSLARRIRERDHELLAAYRHLRRWLVLGGGVVVLGAFLIAPPIAGWLLGPDWEMVPSMIRWMSPLYGIMFAVTPMSVSFFVFDDQRFFFGNQLAFFLISLFSFGIGVVQEDVMVGVILFSALSAVRYLVVLWRIRHLHHQASMALESGP